MKAAFSLVVSVLLQACRLPTAHAALSPYAPSSVPCPSTPLLRAAEGISAAEAAYIQRRGVKAASALNSWLQSLKAGFAPLGSSSPAPVVAGSWSGGGYLALLLGAGSRQAWDAREPESTSAVAGLLQTFTYESGLSGGAWFLAGVAGNDYPRISDLIRDFYLPNIQSGLLAPGGPLGAIPNILDITLRQAGSKQAAGYEVNIVDLYGRLLGYNLLSGPSGGISKRFSDIAAGRNFSDADVALPIIMNIAINATGNRCANLMDPSQAQIEITPFEFGSWDASIRAFTPTKYLGTRLVAGRPAVPGRCTAGYDSTAFIQATSGNVLVSNACDAGNGPLGDGPLRLYRALEQGLLQIKGTTDPIDTAGASYPNPFYKAAGTGIAPAYSSGSQLYLMDGGFTRQGNPIWPHLHRNVSVLLVVDATNTTASLYQTYVAARKAGLRRMPEIPAPAAYDNATMPRFFGCRDAQSITLLWLPGFSYAYPIDVTGGELQLRRDQIQGLLANGRISANGNAAPDWPVCVGCAIVAKTGDRLPGACAACFDKYCWN